MSKPNTFHRSTEPKALEAALSDAGISLENLRTEVSRNAADLALFKPKDGNNFGGPWVRDVIAPGDGDTWCAIIGAPDGKTYELDFTIDDKSVTLSGEPREVIQQVTYETAAASVSAGDVEGHEFHGNQFSQGVATANAQSDKADKASKSAEKKGTSEANYEAVKEHAKAAQMHTDMAHMAKASGDKVAQRTHEAIAAQHEHARAMHFSKAKELLASSHEHQTPTHNWKGAAFEAFSVEAPTKFDGFMAMAGGVQTFTLGYLGTPLTVTVNVNPASASTLQQLLEAVNAASPQKAFNCFDHEKKAASSWPQRFYWKTEKNAIYEVAEPSKAGLEAVEGKTYRGFSLTFFTDAEVTPRPAMQGGGFEIKPGARGSKEDPAEFVCPEVTPQNVGAFLNMGTLTNRPASKQNEPLFASQVETRPVAAQINSPTASAAARTAGAPTHPSKIRKTTIMEKPQLDAAALQARCEQLEQKIVELSAQDTAIAKSDLRAAQAELEASQAKLELAKQNEKIISLEAAEVKRKETAADEAVAKMIDSQQIAMLDKELQASWKTRFIADPTLIPLIVKAKAPNSRVTAGSVALTASLGYGDVGEDPRRIYRHLGELCKRQMRAFGMEASDCKLRSDTAKEFALVYRKEIRGAFDAEGCPTVKPEFIYTAIDRAIPMEAAADTDTLGTLVGTLVTQRTLDLFRYKFPLISRIMTDMSDQPSDLNQAVSTRKVLVPAVQTFDTTLDTDGYPKGWDVASSAQTTDINITLDELVGVPIPFSMAALSSTQRQLFGEQAEAQVYALIKYFLAKLYAVCTTANFNAYAVVTAADAQGVIKVPTAYASYPKALIDFARSAAAEIGVAFDANEVPEEMRTLLLNAQYYGKATQDPSIVTFFAGQQAPGIITDGKLPNLSGFVPVKAPNFPGTNNRVGIALQKNGLLAKSRLPANLMDVFPGAGNGTSTQVTEPDTGFSMMMVRYIDNKRGFAAQLAAAILGAAKGDVRGGLVLTSQ